MAGFKVNHSLLDSYGSSIWVDGIGLCDQGLYAREYAGRTDGFTGVLALLTPLVDGSDPGSVTGALATHYDQLDDIVSKTGEAVQRTAKMYATTETANARRLDSSAPTVHDGHDVAGDGKAHYRQPGGMPAETFPSPSSDPSLEARNNMAIDVKAIDWLFNKATGHHITDPIDAIVGNWTTVQADAASWGTIGKIFGYWAGDLQQLASAIDQVWDGNAAATFQAYMTRLTGAVKGEGDVAGALELLLNKVASELESTFNGAVSLLQSVIHQVEAAALLLAATWWTGVGDAAAVEKAGEALDDFMKTWRIVNAVIKLVKLARVAMLAYYKIKDIVEKVISVPSMISNDIGDIKTGLHDIGAAPGVLQNLEALPKEPTVAYGGADAPGIS